MSSIDDISKSISEMTDDELRSKLLEIRQGRRAQRQPSQTTKKAKKSGGEVNLESLLMSLSADDIAAFLSKTGGDV